MTLTPLGLCFFSFRVSASWPPRRSRGVFALPPRRRLNGKTKWPAWRKGRPDLGLWTSLVWCCRYRRRTRRWTSEKPCISLSLSRRPLNALAPRLTHHRTIPSSISENQKSSLFTAVSFLMCFMARACKSTGQKYWWHALTFKCLWSWLFCIAKPIRFFRFINHDSKTC